MIEVLIAGERDTEALADMALTRMRPRIPEWTSAVEVHHDDPAFGYQFIADELPARGLKRARGIC